MDLDHLAATRSFAAAPCVETAHAALAAALRARKPVAGALRWVLDVSRWDQLGPALQELAARCVECFIPDLTFDGLSQHALGRVTRRVATFSRTDRSHLHLVPAGAVELGFDRSRLHIDEAQLEELRRWSVATFGAPAPGPLEAIQDVLDAIQPPRTLMLEPFLIERTPREWQGWTFLGLDLDRDDQDVADVLARFRVGDLRLPTVDEWEHACAGGSRELFRWGADVPLEQWPSDEGPWALHAKPNAFGLVFPWNSYRTELCTPYDLRGGDGGTLAHGGCRYGAWLSLATAFDGTRMLLEDAGLDLHDCSPDLRLVQPLTGVL